MSFTNVRFRLDSRSGGTVTQETAAKRRRKNGRPVRERISFSFGSFFFFLPLFNSPSPSLSPSAPPPLFFSYALSAHSVVTENGSSRRDSSAVATFCGFRRRKKFRFRNHRPDTSLVIVTCGARCLFFFSSRSKSSDYTESHSEAEHRGALRRSLNRRDARFLPKLAMTYDTVDGVLLLA